MYILTGMQCARDTATLSDQNCAATRGLRSILRHHRPLPAMLSPRANPSQWSLVLRRCRKTNGRWTWHRRKLCKTRHACSHATRQLKFTEMRSQAMARVPNPSGTFKALKLDFTSDCAPTWLDQPCMSRVAQALHRIMYCASCVCLSQRARE